MYPNFWRGWKFESWDLKTSDLSHSVRDRFPPNAKFILTKSEKNQEKHLFSLLGGFSQQVGYGQISDRDSCACARVGVCVYVMCAILWSLSSGFRLFLQAVRSRANRECWRRDRQYFFGIIVTLLVKLLKTEEKVRTGHVTKKLTLGSCGDQRNEGGTVWK